MRRIEQLEDRQLLSALTPAQVSHAYALDAIQFAGVKGDGTGQTIAIIDAYDAPNIFSDLSTFNTTFGIQNIDGQGNPILTKATPQGVPATNSLWAEEASLDVEWAHAIAPGAHILLVEANSSSISALMAAVDYARNQPNVSVVSMSWGAGEFSTETSYDSYFTTPSNHTRVSFVASTGDQGGVTQWPAVSPNVVGVGGTTLTVDASNNYVGETAWGGTGGGISTYESKPSYQSTVTQSSNKKTSPDLAYVADGVQICYNGGFTTVGGTSCGAPQIAAMIAIVDQGRTLNGRMTLDGRADLLPALYSVNSTDYHDITTGSAGSFNASVGYDLTTGRGSPVGNLLVNDLSNVVNATLGGGGGNNGHHGNPHTQVKLHPLEELTIYFSLENKFVIDNHKKDLFGLVAEIE